VQSVTAVSGSNNTQFDVLFATQSADGTYTAAIGPDLADTAGNLMNQDGDSTNGELVQDVFTTTATISSTRTFAWIGNVPIRDGRETLVPLDVFANLTIGDLNVSVEIEHTWVADLGVAIIDPSGNVRWLIDGRGGSGDNILATFDDEAGTPVSAGSAPFDGTFQPEESLNAFDGRSTQGTWQLYVVDYTRGDRGKIKAFLLIVTPQSGAAAFEAPADAGVGLRGIETETGIVQLDLGRSPLPFSGAGFDSPLMIAGRGPRISSPLDSSSGETERDEIRSLSADAPRRDSRLHELDAVFGDFESLQGELLSA
jgi:subtilisin-like proprotein convertase family protein